jgi:Mn2+/Fe2+ NRAMP family transporter
MEKLNRKAWTGLLVTAVITGLVVFTSAGTVRYWEAWVYLVLFFGVSAVMILYLMRRDPALLERRLSGGPVAEKRTAQRVIMTRLTRKSTRTGPSLRSGRQDLY